MRTEAENRVLEATRLLLDLSKRTQGALSQHLGFKGDSQLSKRLSGEIQLKVAEVDEIAAFFDVPFTLLLEDKEGVLRWVYENRREWLLDLRDRPTRSRWFSDLSTSEAETPELLLAGR